MSTKRLNIWYNFHKNKKKKNIYAQFSNVLVKYLIEV